MTSFAGFPRNSGVWRHLTIRQMSETYSLWWTMWSTLNRVAARLENCLNFRALLEKVLKSDVALKNVENCLKIAWIFNCVLEKKVLICWIRIGLKKISNITESSLIFERKCCYLTSQNHYCPRPKKKFSEGTMELVRSVRASVRASESFLDSNQTYFFEFLIVYRCSRTRYFRHSTNFDPF